MIVFDELVHNSMRMGLKLSRGSTLQFKHNDMLDLRRVLEQVCGVDEDVERNLVSGWCCGLWFGVWGRRLCLVELCWVDNR